MQEQNIQWIKACINSCTNIEQLKTCEILIALFKFRLLKDGIKEEEAYRIESDILETYVNKEANLLI